jgi:TPR repeat protein
MKKLLALIIVLLANIYSSDAMASNEERDHFIKGYEAFQRGDFDTAMRSFTIVGRTDNGFAYAFIGRMYYEGIGVPKDYNTSFKWFTKSAERGSAMGQIYMGISYGGGFGILRNYIRSHMWTSLGILNVPNMDIDTKMWKGLILQLGLTIREKIEEKLTPSHLGTAQRLARECVQNDYKGC